MRAKNLWLAGVMIPLLLLGCTSAPPAGGGPPVDPADPVDPIDPAPPSVTGLEITTPPGSAGEIFDLFTADGGTLLSQAHDTNEVQELEPGTYLLTGYFNEGFVFARDVVVNAGQVTTIAFGAVQVATAPGSELALYDIYDQTGDALLSRPNDSDVSYPVPPGTYVLKKYFSDAFVYARDVVVVAGQTTVVPFGGVLVTTAAGSELALYDIYDEAGTTLLSQPNDSDEIVPVPPGTYTLKEYFTAFTYVSGLTVVANETTTFEMGAIRYEGAESNYDIYDAGGSNLLVRPASANESRAIPPGTYDLKDYFSETVLAEDVVIAAGQITTVP